MIGTNMYYKKLCYVGHVEGKTRNVPPQEPRQEYRKYEPNYFQYRGCSPCRDAVGRPVITIRPPTRHKRDRGSPDTMWATTSGRSLPPSACVGTPRDRSAGSRWPGRTAIGSRKARGRRPCL